MTATKYAADAGAAETGAASEPREQPVFASAGARWAAIWKLMIFDHGVLRLFFYNRWRLSSEAWRSAQPAPWQVRAMARRGLKTVVTLRGGRQAEAYAAYALEKEACRDSGIALKEIKLLSRGAPKPEQLEAAFEALESIEYPALFHCKSGADRAGLMSALYVLVRGSGDLDEAKAQLALRYGHFRHSKTGVLDAFLESYGDAKARADADGRPLDFVTWTRTEYDWKALQASVRARPWADVLVDHVLRRE